MSRNNQLSGKVVGDNLMDLYYQRMCGIYAVESHTYKKGLPHDFSKLMKAYLFLSVHPKFEVEIPIDEKRPSSKNPNFAGQMKRLLRVRFVTAQICLL